MAGMPWPGAVAVSGGGDSLALMHLLAGWSRTAKAAPPLVLSVDHGLRKESAGEARAVARWAKALGLKCEILTVKTAQPKSDIEAWARAARLAQMGARLARHRLTTLYLGHHEGDQAETFLLRLARGSGLDGLAAMQSLAPFPHPDFPDLSVARPLLAMPREALRDYLQAKKQAWLEDPMNSEARFARSRIRALMPALAAAGLTPGRIADAAAHLARAREALDLATAAVLAQALAQVGGGQGPIMLLLDPAALAAAPREIGLRALAALLRTVSGAPYRPRFDALERLFDRMATTDTRLGQKSGQKSGLGGGATLHGCRIGPAPVRHQAFGPKTLVITKESSRKRTKNA
jgi:tRNA(Ile)-lysidine synthase